VTRSLACPDGTVQLTGYEACQDVSISSIGVFFWKRPTISRFTGELSRLAFADPRGPSFKAARVVQSGKPKQAGLHPHIRGPKPRCGSGAGPAEQHRLSIKDDLAGCGFLRSWTASTVEAFARAT